jgi:RNA polymerase sigma factor (sigma-70 family)
MSAVLPAMIREPRCGAATPGYIFHESFVERDARNDLDPRELLTGPSEYAAGYMPDDVTRDFARRMHYAAYRVRRASGAEAVAWRRAYLALRDRIVLGNQKLVYKAVRSRKAWQMRSDDLIGDGFVVLIAAVERFNPWLGIRFSTYAYTCLVRGLVRQSRKQITFEKRFQVQPDLPDEASPPNERKPGKPSPADVPLERALQVGHPLLSEREKLILRMRYGIGDQDREMKLETIGTRLGLSKERIRQLQVGALAKLREALLVADGM